MLLCCKVAQMKQQLMKKDLILSEHPDRCEAQQRQVENQLSPASITGALQHVARHLLMCRQQRQLEGVPLMPDHASSRLLNSLCRDVLTPPPGGVSPER